MTEGEAGRPGPAVPLGRRRHQTRRALEGAARELFAEHGYADTRVADIARGAGVTPPTFYAYFSSKGTAFEAVTGTKSPAMDLASDGPATARGRRTRRVLLDAARAVFESDGFVNARIVDITQRAGVAAGTFYTYFDSKEDVVRALARDIASELVDRSGAFAASGFDDPVTQIRESIRQYLESYARHGRLLAVFDEAVAHDATMAELEHTTWRSFVDRAARGIRRWQREGLADSDLDAETAASALAAMVGHFAHIWINVGEPHDPAVALDTLTRLWAQGIGLRMTSSDSAHAGPSA